MHTVGAVTGVDRAGAHHHRDGILCNDGLEYEVRHRVHFFHWTASSEINYEIFAGQMFVKPVCIRGDVEFDEILLGIRLGGSVFGTGKIEGGDVVTIVESGQVGTKTRADMTFAAEE